MRPVRCLLVCSAFACVVAASPDSRPGIARAEDKKRDMPSGNGRDLKPFNEKRDAVHPAVVQVIKDGKFTVLE